MNDFENILLSAAAQNRQAGRLDQAEAMLKQILSDQPGELRAAAELSLVYWAMGRPDSATQVLEMAGDASSESGSAYLRLGYMYRAQLKHEQAVAAFRRAVHAEPDNHEYLRAFVSSLLYCPSIKPQARFREIREIGRAIEASAPKLFAQFNCKHEPIRIGYLGSAMRAHSVSYFLLPIIKASSERFSVLTYNLSEIEDDVTKRIKAHSWRYSNLSGMSSEAAAKKIYRDGVNILVDLDGYSADIVPLQILSHKPAPLQVSWIGWPDTTGLDRIDYRIVDHYTDPVGSIADNSHTEKLVRMPGSFSVYSPPLGAPVVNDLPALTNGYITFGSFNNLYKMNDDVIALWAKLMLAIPESILVLKFVKEEDPILRKSIEEKFANWGVAVGRLRFFLGTSRVQDHLRNFHSVDISLDPFPYNGTTTSCDSLWMGVPVIAMSGNLHLSRVGLSQMTNIGMPQLCASKEDEYVAIARNLAMDLNGLRSIRMGLREQMLNSPLMDAEGFIVQYEAWLNLIWREYRETGADV